jgi:hypothetical protein
MQEEARAGGAGLALPDEAHSGDDAVDDPILVGVGIRRSTDFCRRLEPAQEQTEVVTGTAFMRLSPRPLRSRLTGLSDAATRSIASRTTSIAS